LIPEYPGILRWVVEGALAWRRDGLGEPAVVQSQIEEYRQEMDDIGGYFREYCEYGSEFSCRARDLWEDFAIWMKVNNVKYISSNAFYRRMTQRGWKSKHTRDGEVYQGIRPTGELKSAANLRLHSWTDRPYRPPGYSEN